MRSVISEISSSGETLALTRISSLLRSRRERKSERVALAMHRMLRREGGKSRCVQAAISDAQDNRMDVYLWCRRLACFGQRQARRLHHNGFAYMRLSSSEARRPRFI